ncbi:hypothetical protein [Streptococcus anginosus]|jgi:hypothetical protein|uniref:Uncharacterized protein n=1 Tax=Streptococcus anginosus DORA_7 TaxID=1403946 RepID=W1TSA0_STRAP|nr:hypothetical protein [Streptococcus anginosus]ETI84512.1 MAG: hypothetical protein Q615_SPAC00127G0156 [Streptococcus anginosus DORA_7]QBX31725.1 hypothetical protein Javan68_0035 [Streptococcus phage Javan68]KAA9305153.1 hypothetical protein F6I02_03890 [Streptococcus anginosus]KAA9321233.1 hypothetical protein F6H95_09405 [Streptococcus anginosus]MCW1006576.1 hypothetical protein [Streptococcus anginosus]
MSEILGAVATLAFFFLAGAFCNHLDWRKAKKQAEQQAKEDERIELEAMYVVCAIEHDRRERARKLAKARKYCTKSFRY